MKKRILTWSFLVVAAPVPFLLAAAQCLCGLEVEYSLNLRQRAEHRCQVEMRIRGINHPYLDLSLPAWNKPLSAEELRRQSQPRHRLRCGWRAFGGPAYREPHLAH